MFSAVVTGWAMPGSLANVRAAGAIKTAFNSAPGNSNRKATSRTVLCSLRKLTLTLTNSSGTKNNCTAPAGTAKSVTGWLITGLLDSDTVVISSVPVRLQGVTVSTCPRYCTHHIDRGDLVGHGDVSSLRQGSLLCRSPRVSSWTAE